jgi:hypothetical protein
MENIQQPLTNVQLEILSAFSFQLNEQDLRALKQTLAQFFANRLVAEADKTWDSKQWNSETEKQLLEQKMRKKSA